MGKSACTSRGLGFVTSRPAISSNLPPCSRVVTTISSPAPSNPGCRGCRRVHHRPPCFLSGLTPLSLL